MLYVLFFNTTYTYYSSIATARKVGARLKLEASRDKKIPLKKQNKKTTTMRNQFLCLLCENNFFLF